MNSSRPLQPPPTCFIPPLKLSSSVKQRALAHSGKISRLSIVISALPMPPTPCAQGLRAETRSSPHVSHQGPAMTRLRPGHHARCRSILSTIPSNAMICHPAPPTRKPSPLLPPPPRTNHHRQASCPALNNLTASERRALLAPPPPLPILQTRVNPTLQVPTCPAMEWQAVDHPTQRLNGLASHLM